MKRIAIAMLVAVAGCRGDGLLSPDVLDFSGTSTIAQDPDYRVPTPAIETTVTITNNTERTFSFRAGDCPWTGLRVFSTPDMGGTPVWSAFDTPFECSAVGVFPSPLNPGESRQLVFFQPVSQVLGATLPAGTYYIDAVVGIYSPQIKSNQVQVNAGAVQLER